MIRTGTVQAAQANRRHLRLANGTGYWRADLIESSAPSLTHPRWTPQAFLVEQDPKSVILPHFHQQDEFQVIVEGHGTLGRHPIRPVTVHYAGRHTGYGPITSGPNGLRYFSLRANTDPGALFLPEARDRMEPVKKRYFLAHANELFEPQEDGLAAWMLSVRPGASLHAPRTPEGAARFYVVLEGDLTWGDTGLPALSSVFADEEFPATSREGARVLCLQFPC